MKIDYTYNDDLSLKKINYNDGNSNNYNLYNYDARKNITSIKTLSRERVEYRYNSLDNLSSVYNNDNLITRYEYENEDSEGIYTGRIYKDVVGNILYEYAYDKRGNIRSRKKNYVNSESYEYDDYDRIINIKNNNNEVVYSYEYGDDYIKETYNEDISHNITYSKNNKIYENENYKKIISIYDNRGDLVNNIKAKYYQIGYALFFDEYIVAELDREVKKSSRLTGENKYIEASTLELPIDIVMEENISCANISNDTSILQYSYDNSNTDITLQFYYKMSSSTSGTILKILYDSVNNVELKIVNQKLRIIYNTYYIEILDTEIILDKWNLITYHIKIEENANSFTITNEVGLNKEYKTLQTNVTNFLKEGTYQINIGGYSDSKCIGYYTGIVINNNSDILSSINEYINLANRYLFKERNKRVVLYNEFDKEIYPLCNNFSSINGKKAFIIKGYSDEQFI